ncbi:MAG TPA: LpqB family beta-propeller domain-containing protein [Micromonosporaceae bacterium]|nr:LpqB family beta-propeller domain-containing protein [Micromonosporaceae bacterium]
MASPARRWTTGRTRLTRRTPWLVLPLLLILGGCGVPGETDVTLDGPVQQRGAATGGSVAVVRGPDGSTDPEDLVRRYLSAGAGGPKGAAGQLRQFFLPEQDQEWLPGAELTVVRVLSGPLETKLGGGFHKVTVNVRLVGALTDRGTVVEPSAPAWRTLEFKVSEQDQQDVPQGAKRLRIAEAPDGMYLASNALDGKADALYQDIYQPYSAYFWDAALVPALVPDLRYLPLTVSEEERLRLLVKWVVDGASEWLGTAGRTSPADIVLRSNVVYSVDRLVVDLTFQAAAADLVPLAKQLAWTLYPIFKGSIELRVEGQPKQQFRATLSAPANPAQPYATEPTTFCVAAGKVQRNCALGEHLAVLEAPQNSQVVAAAVARNQQCAALVRTDAGSRRRLVVGQVVQETPSYTATRLTGVVMSRPSWLPPPSAQCADAQGLVAVDGRLHVFTAGSASTSVVKTASRAVTGVSVAPDGLRVVMAADGAAHVATLVRKGDTLELQRLRQLPASLTGISAVAWSRPDRVVLLGQEGGRHALTELTVDGAIEEALHVPLGEAVVTQLSAYPNPPGDGLARRQVLVEFQNKAWRGTTDRLDEIEVGLAPGASPDPARATIVPSAPFYQD